jgi:lipoate-protein ligase B
MRFSKNTFQFRIIRTTSTFRVSLCKVGRNYSESVSIQRRNIACDRLNRKPTLAWKYLGRVAYLKALHLQNLTVQARMGSAFRNENASNHVVAPNVMYLLEHNPVYTAGRRIKGTLNSTGDRLRRETQADYYEVERGGQTTFHGPGQLIGYPIFHLQELKVEFKTVCRCYLCTSHYYF